MYIYYNQCVTMYIFYLLLEYTMQLMAIFEVLKLFSV